MSKFKLNWGWSLLIVYATFIIVFMFYFFKSFQEAASNDMVEEDYYQKELMYGDVIAKKQNADTMRVQVKILNDANGITVVFPDYLSDTDVSGNITLYKPDNKKLDRIIPFKLNKSKQSILKSDLVSGKWTVFLDWKIKETPFYIEKKLFVK
jgi:hypothetical protein